MLKSQSAEERSKNRKRIEALEQQTMEFEREARRLAERIERQKALREQTAQSVELLDHEKHRLEDELDTVRDELQQVLQDKYWLYEQWQSSKSDMD